MSCPVYTGPWALLRGVPSSVAVPVRTSVGVPRFIRGAGGLPALRELTPYGLLHFQDRDEFRRPYRDRLEHHGVARIRAELDNLQAAAQGTPIVLCCFESDRADCHRGDFADWWHERPARPRPN
jgi:Protein of unknown function, DUF488